MKIRSLLLGSIAAAGLSTAGYAADLGVVTSLDICDDLGLSGLSISSDDNCLVITGGVSVEYSIGDYEDPGVLITLALGNVEFAQAGGVLDSDLDVDAWLQFVATAPSDFGNASATIKLLSENNNNDTDAIADDWDIVVDKAWVSIGDTTVLSAGKKSSIFLDGDDKPLNYLGLFNSGVVDAGVGFATAGAATGGVGISLNSDLGNGLKIGGAIENLNTTGVADVPTITAVGVISYSGDGITLHGSGAMDQAGAWKAHAGFTGAWDPIKVVGAISADDTGWWNALGSLSATFDMFTLAASAEATSAGELGVGGSISATVSEGVTVNLGSRWIDNGANTAYQAEAGVSAAVAEAITLTAAVGVEGGTQPGVDFIYGKAGLAWAPGGGFDASVNGYVNSLGAFKGTFKASKSIK